MIQTLPACSTYLNAIKEGRLQFNRPTLSGTAIVQNSVDQELPPVSATEIAAWERDLEQQLEISTKLAGVLSTARTVWEAGWYVVKSSSLLSFREST